VTMAAALASLYTGRKVRSDTSMTGEITLSGLVFPVGGIKEKVMAAHRAGISHDSLHPGNLIILPRQAKPDPAPPDQPLPCPATPCLSLPCRA